MPYLPITVPGPHIDEVNAPFWEHCNAQRLMFQQCGDCLQVVHPPLPICPRCQSLTRQWLEAPADAVVFSYTWAYTAAHESARSCLPYNVALVEFPAMPGVRFVSNVINVEHGQLAIGDRLALEWEPGGAGQLLARFRKI